MTSTCRSRRPTSKSATARASGSNSRYGTCSRIQCNDRFRVMASVTDGDHVAAASRSIRLRRR